jgi:hypothetical protein
MYYEVISIAYGSAADSDAGPRLLNDRKKFGEIRCLSADVQSQ